MIPDHPEEEDLPMRSACKAAERLPLGERPLGRISHYIGRVRDGRRQKVTISHDESCPPRSGCEGYISRIELEGDAG